MAAIVWSTALSTIDAALATATATDLAIGQPIRNNLYTLGTFYDGVYTQAVDAAKASSQSLFAAAGVAWETSTTVVYNQAVEAARYAESLHGTPAAAAAFDPDTGNHYAKSRIYEAHREAASPTLRVTLLDHFKAVDAAFKARPVNPVEVVPYDGPIRIPYGVQSIGRGSSVRELETDLLAAVASANEWAALATYV